MAFVAVPALGVVAGGVSAIIVAVVKHQKENHPLVKAEKHATSGDHTLEIDQAKVQELQRLVEMRFVTGSRLDLCFQIFRDNGPLGFYYEHWFVKCGDWIVEFGSGGGLAGAVWQNTVDVHCNPRHDYHIKKSVTITPEMVARIKLVVGATNYSLLLRNCEHIANYIFEGRWISMQTLQNGFISQRLLEFVTDREQRAFRNVLPSGLAWGEEVASGPMYSDLAPRVVYANTLPVLDVNDTEAYNVLLLGPTGSGKSNLVNQIFNRKVALSADRVRSVTKNIAFYTGTADVSVLTAPDTSVKMNKRVNIIDSIGFCDSRLSADEVYRIIQQSIIGNAARLHKVVIMTSSRIENVHRDSIKQVLSWLNYDPAPQLRRSPSLSFCFLYTKTDGKSDDEKQNLLIEMCDELGAGTCERCYRTRPGAEPVLFEGNLAVGLNPAADFSEIEEDYKKVMRLVFDTPTTPVLVNRSSGCAIL